MLYQSAIPGLTNRRSAKGLCLLCLLWLLAGGFPLASGKAPTPAPIYSLPADQSAVILRKPRAARLREFRRQRAFQYIQIKSEQNAWDRFWQRLANWLQELLRTPVGRITWKYGVYAFMVAALVFAVLKLLQVDVTKAFGRAPKRAALAYDTTTENIHALDFTALLTEAEAKGNYRLAVRLGYLFVLKQLTDRSLIQWQPDKTNHDYLTELTTTQLRAGFQELTRQFEYAWYGEQPLTAEQYALVRTARLGFLHQLTSNRAA
ncbi:DUF4129 domain-containing protein [Hymenobacter sp. BT730]|uniref:DUF4129 domain-containing protein n=1 Tax=Hymenobacter sp. BT730 TaxID=3063332 RepID=UPI0026E05642|nr:DUF4129 domain-containing protein [Hymenobacter sp. BT730]